MSLDICVYIEDWQHMWTAAMVVNCVFHYWYWVVCYYMHGTVQTLTLMGKCDTLGKDWGRRMIAAKLKVLWWKAVWKVIMLVSCFIILMNLFEAQLEYENQTSEYFKTRNTEGSKNGNTRKNNNTQPAIPHIIHQTWDSPMIPKQVWIMLCFFL